MAGSVIDTVTGAAGKIVGGLIGAGGDQRAADQFQQAAQQSQLIVQPQQFLGNSLFTRIDPRGQALLTPLGQRRNQEIANLFNQAFRRARDFNSNQFQQRLLRAADDVTRRRESQAFDSLESRLFNRQGVHTGTARQIADFRSDVERRREERAFRRATEAELFAEQVQRGRLGDVAGLFGLSGDLDDRFLRLQGQSLQGAQLLAPFGISNPQIAQAGAFRAQSTQDFFRGLGGIVGGVVDTGLSSLRAPASSASTGGGFFNPGAVSFEGGFTSPFASLGF